MVIGSAEMAEHFVKKVFLSEVDKGGEVDDENARNVVIETVTRVSAEEIKYEDAKTAVAPIIEEIYNTDAKEEVGPDGQEKVLGTDAGILISSVVVDNNVIDLAIEEKAMPVVEEIKESEAVENTVDSTVGIRVTTTPLCSSIPVFTSSPRDESYLPDRPSSALFSQSDWMPPGSPYETDLSNNDHIPPHLNNLSSSLPEIQITLVSPSTPPSPSPSPVTTPPTVDTKESTSFPEAMHLSSAAPSNASLSSMVSVSEIKKKEHVTDMCVEAEIDAETDIEIEIVKDPETEPIMEIEPESEPGMEIEPESELEQGMEIGSESEPVMDTEPESDPVMNMELELETDREMDLEPEIEQGMEISVEVGKRVMSETKMDLELETEAGMKMGTESEESLESIKRPPVSSFSFNPTSTPIRTCSLGFTPPPVSAEPPLSFSTGLQFPTSISTTSVDTPILKTKVSQNSISTTTPATPPPSIRACFKPMPPVSNQPNPPPLPSTDILVSTPVSRTAPTASNKTDHKTISNAEIEEFLRPSLPIASTPISIESLLAKSKECGTNNTPSSLSNPYSDLPTECSTSSGNTDQTNYHNKMSASSPSVILPPVTPSTLNQPAPAILSPVATEKQPCLQRLVPVVCEDPSIAQLGKLPDTVVKEVGAEINETEIPSPLGQEFYHSDPICFNDLLFALPPFKGPEANIPSHTGVVEDNSVQEPTDLILHLRSVLQQLQQQPENKPNTPNVQFTHQQQQLLTHLQQMSNHPYPQNDVVVPNGSWASGPHTEKPAGLVVSPVPENKPNTPNIPFTPQQQQLLTRLQQMSNHPHPQNDVVVPNGSWASGPHTEKPAGLVVSPVQGDSTDMQDLISRLQLLKIATSGMQTTKVQTGRPGMDSSHPSVVPE
eukprot:Ihof_evm8s217 gene=Ihof_evmTU8s217